MASVRFSKSDKEEALQFLREQLKPGDTVHTILRHVSRSGMMRRISVVKIDSTGTRQFDRAIAALGIGSIDRDYEGVKVGGAGMDMGFWLVYELSHALFPDGFGCVGKGPNGSGVYCPSNDHSNGDRDYTPHTAGKPLHELAEPGKKECWENPRGHAHWHRSGGYALKHRWL